MNVGSGSLAIQLRDLRRPGALKAFEQRTAWPMLGVVMASLVALLLPLFASLSPRPTTALVVIDWLLWIVFVAEYAVRLFLAIDRRWFVRHNLIDLGVVALPMFPAIRALRIARLFRIGVVGARLVDHSGSVFKRSNTKYAIGLALLVALLAALMVWSVEREDPTSTIHTFPDALWWAVTTLTTVGYGDKYPVSFEGKMVALSLMFVGIAVFGLIAAALASLFVESENHDDHNELVQRMARLEAKIDALSMGSDGSRAGSSSPPTTESSETKHPFDQRTHD